MKRVLTRIAAATLLAGLPFAASAGHDDDDDRRHGGNKHERYHNEDQHWKRSKHAHHYYQKDRYYRAPPRVVHHHYEHAPRVIERPVYVPVVPHNRVDVRLPLPHADVGFRLFF